MFSWAQKRISLRYPCPGGRVISIFVFFLFTYCSFGLLIVITASRPLKLAKLAPSFVIAATICSLVLYSHINATYFIPLFPWFNSSKLDSCLLVTKKNSSYGRYVLPKVILYDRFLFFHSAMLSKASPWRFFRSAILIAT